MESGRGFLLCVGCLCIYEEYKNLVFTVPARELFISPRFFIAESAERIMYGTGEII